VLHRGISWRASQNEREGMRTDIITSQIVCSSKNISLFPIISNQYHTLRVSQFLVPYLRVHLPYQLKYLTSATFNPRQLTWAKLQCLILASSPDLALVGPCLYPAREHGYGLAAPRTVRSRSLGSSCWIPVKCPVSRRGHPSLHHPTVPAV